MVSTLKSNETRHVSLIHACGNPDILAAPCRQVANGAPSALAWGADCWSMCWPVVGCDQDAAALMASRRLTYNLSAR